MADPREKDIKKNYMKIFFNNNDLYNEFLELYDAAVEDGSTRPEDVAMIHFRDRYVEADNGWIGR